MPIIHIGCQQLSYDDTGGNAYCRVLDVSVLVTGELLKDLLEEANRELARAISDEGFRKLRGRKEPVHLFSLRWEQKVDRQQATLLARGMKTATESRPQIAKSAKDDALGLLLSKPAIPDQECMDQNIARGAITAHAE